MAQGLWQTGDLDGAVTTGQQALALAAALGERALQGEASYIVGLAYYAIGDFGRATEQLRRNVEAADRESGTSGADVRIRSQAWLGLTLSTLGAFAEGRRHGEEALHLATLESRGNTPINEQTVERIVMVQRQLIQDIDVPELHRQSSQIIGCLLSLDHLIERDAQIGGG